MAERKEAGMSEGTYPAGVTMNDHIVHDMRAKRFPRRSTIGLSGFEC